MRLRPRLFVAIFFLFALVPSFAFARTFISVNDGNWNDPNTWGWDALLGSYGTGNGQFIFPNGVGVSTSTGDIYVVDRGNSRIQKFDSSGTFLATWGSSGSGDGQFNLNDTNPFPGSPVGVLPVGNSVYVVDTKNNRIQKFDSDGNFVLKWGSSGSADGQFSNPRVIAADSAGNLYVTDYSNNRIQKFDSDGNFIAKWGSAGTAEGQFNKPEGIAIDSGDNVYVTDSSNHRIQKFDSNGNFLMMWGAGVQDGVNILETCTSSCRAGTGNTSPGGMFGPYAVAVDSSGGKVYMLDLYGQGRLEQYDTNGAYIATFFDKDSRGTLPGKILWPQSVTVQPDGSVLVTNSYNNRVDKWSSSGHLSVFHDCSLSNTCVAGIDYPSIRDSVAVYGHTVTVPGSVTAKASSVLSEVASTFIQAASSILKTLVSVVSLGTYSVDSSATQFSFLGGPQVSSSSNAGFPNAGTIAGTASPTLTVTCKDGDTVTLYNGATALSSGTCAGESASFTPTLSIGTSSLFVTESNGIDDAAGIQILDARSNTLLGTSLRATDRNHIWVSYIDAANDQIVVQYTSDGGETWVRNNVGSCGTSACFWTQSMIIGSDGLPRFAYAKDDSVMYSVCSTADCSAVTTTTVNTPGSGHPGRWIAIALDGNDNPFILYHHGLGNSSGGQVVVARYVGSGGTCSNSQWKCSTIDAGGGHGMNVIMNGSNLPIISYVYNFNTIKLLQCFNADCTSNATTTFAKQNTYFDYADPIAMATSTDGHLRLGYYDNNTAQFIYCNDGQCGSYTKNTVSSNTSYAIAMALDSRGIAHFAYRFNSALAAAPGATEAVCTDILCSSVSSTLVQAPIPYGVSGSNGSTALALAGDEPLLAFSSEDGFGIMHFYAPPISNIFVDLNAPIVSSAAVGSITSSGATVTWSTDEAASSKVSYGTTVSYGSNTTEADTNPTVTSHTVTLSGLSSCTTYHLKVISRDPAGNSGESSDLSFQTTGCSTGGGGGVVGSSPIAPSAAGVMGNTALNGATNTGGTNTNSNTANTPANKGVVVGIVITRNYQIWDRSEEIRALQKYLNTHGYQVAKSSVGSPGHETSIFGNNLYRTISKYQKDHGLAATGYIGPKTRALLKEGSN